MKVLDKWYEFILPAQIMTTDAYRELLVDQLLLVITSFVMKEMAYDHYLWTSHFTYVHFEANPIFHTAGGSRFSVFLSSTHRVKGDRWMISICLSLCYIWNKHGMCRVTFLMFSSILILFLYTFQYHVFHSFSLVWKHCLYVCTGKVSLRTLWSNRRLYDRQDNLIDKLQD